MDNGRVDGPANRTSVQMLETRAIDYIPWRERHGKVWQQGPFWFASNFVLLTMAVGFAGPLSGLGFGWTSVAVILGAAISTFFMAFHANQGPTLGVPQLIQSRAQFGTRGVIFALLAALVIYVGFNVFDAAMATQGFQAITGHGSAWTWCLGIILVQLVIAVVGHDMIHLVERWMTYLLVIAFGVLTVGFVSLIGANKVFVMGPFSAVAFFTQLAAAAGYMIAYVIYVSDYTRYLPPDTKLGPLVLWTYAGPVVATSWLMPLGALFATTLKGGATVTSVFTAGNLVAPGLGTAVMALSCIAVVAVMSLNTYGAALVALTAIDAFQPIRSSLRTRVIATVLLSILMLLLSLVLPESYQSAFQNFLSLILYFLVPWSAINLVDYYWVRRGRYSVMDLFTHPSIYRRWSWRGLLAYAIGFAAMVPFFVLPFMTGPAAKKLGGVDIAFIFGLLASGGVYYALARTLDLKSEEAAWRISSATLEPAAAHPADLQGSGHQLPAVGELATGLGTYEL